jgi:hypothetical protein
MRFSHARRVAGAMRMISVPLLSNSPSSQSLIRERSVLAEETMTRCALPMKTVFVPAWAIRALRRALGSGSQRRCRRSHSLGRWHPQSQCSHPLRQARGIRFRSFGWLPVPGRCPATLGSRPLYRADLGILASWRFDKSFYKLRARVEHLIKPCLPTRARAHRCLARSLAPRQPE